MGATVPVLTGGAVGPTKSRGAINILRVPFTMPGPASYDTGGSLVTLPSIPGYNLRGINIFNPLNAALTRYASWDGVKTTPKIRWLTALPGTQVTAAVDLSAESISGEFEYEG